MRPTPRLIAAALTAVTAVCAPACTSSESSPTSPASIAARAFAGTASAAAVTSTAAVSGSPGQLFKGWGLYPAAGTGAFWNKSAIQTAVYSLGATFVREQIDPALYVSGNTVGNIVLNQSLLNGYIAKLQVAYNSGATSYVMAVWSPPASMKTNNSLASWIDYNGDGIAESNELGYLSSASEPAFVAFLTKVMLSIKAAGFPLPTMLSIQNEPEHAATYAGCIYTPAQWQKVIQDVRGAFDYNGLGSVGLFGPETGTYGANIYQNYITDTPGFMGGPGFPALDTAYLNHSIGAYAHHMYGECNVPQMQDAMAAHPKDAYLDEFSEIENDDQSELNKTIDMLRAIGAAMVIVPHNYWAWWNGYTSSTGAPDGQSLVGGTSTPIYTKRYWALKKLFNTVRPGWTVRTMTSSDPSLYTSLGSQDQCAARIDLVAFVNGSWTQTAVLMTNVSTSARQITVSGLEGSSVTPYLTNSSNDMEPQTTVAVTNHVATISMPAQSAVLAVTN
jgi:glucuronoarabinoxylan endo-1,4-beta-xylanase